MPFKQTTLPITRRTNRSDTIHGSGSAGSGITVVNAKVSELRKSGYQNLADFLLASEDHVYVGRDTSRYVRGAKGSKWQNKFKLSDHNDNLEQVLSLYEDYVRNGPLFNQLDELRGKTLACWCFPSPCHATILANLLDEQARQLR